MSAKQITIKALVYYLTVKRLDIRLFSYSQRKVTFLLNDLIFEIHEQN